MKVIKPFVRDGVRYNRGDAAPTGLDKQAVAHYLQLGLVEQNASAAGSSGPKPGAKTVSAPPPPPAPQRRQTLPGPQERKPASPNETALAGATGGPVAGEQVAIAGVPPGSASEVVATPDPVAASLPLGPVDGEGAKA